MSDVRAECRERYGGLFSVPCIAIPRSDSSVEQHECNDWCPLLRRLIEDADDEDLIDDARTD